MKKNVFSSTFFILPLMIPIIILGTVLRIYNLNTTGLEVDEVSNYTIATSIYDYGYPSDKPELGQSRQVYLLAMGINNVSTVSFPFGYYSDSVVNIVKQNGFIGSRTTDQGFNLKNGDPYTLKSYSLENTATFDQIKLLIDQAVSQRSWLILVFHQIDNTGWQFSTTPEKLQQVVTYLKTNNIPVVTATQGISQMSIN